MTQRTTLAAALVAVTALVGGGVAVWPAAQAAPEPGNPGITRLRAEATAGLKIERDPDGDASFVGTSAGNSIVNPAVSAASGVRAAARAHLARYGAALGVASDAEMSPIRSRRSVSGQDVVRFQQEVDSAPVLGGQVVVSLREDRQLSSMLATVSRVRSLPAATISEASARTTAVRAAARAAGAEGLTTTSEGRAVWDPTLFDAAVGTPQGVWSFEIGDGIAVRRTVLVDDTSGRVLVNRDLIEHVDRVVCDQGNVPGDATACTSGFARVEGGPASGVDDVNDAFVHAGSVSTAYQQLGGIDLTSLIGIDVGGVNKLASTVRYCPPDAPVPCEYPNAFWNGAQMYYGDSYAGADDVVGHEMTHGVVDHFSELFYWGQSGAINESMADIMGEIVDHRAGLQPRDADWLLGEDLPGAPIRDMKNPPAFGDPDRMTSPNYMADLGYADNGGVHVNSGVGNKTAYLISQGGSFNGQSIVGIDGADTGLTKTGQLYVDALTKLTSGSRYVDLAAVLEQSCADFVTSGESGFTSADCTSIANSVLATELRTTPTNAPQPPEALRSCPTGTTMRELFNSESGAPATSFTVSGGLWNYGVSPDFGPNATSGRESWLGFNPDPLTYGDPAASSLTMARGITVPPGQQTFLHFQQWRLFEWTPRPAPTFYDGGTVEINGADAATLPWTNGPQQTLSGAPWTGRRAFAGDSFGYTSSQLDLSSFGGHTVRPQFTVRGDEGGSYIGWWLDDIVVYTCDPPPSAPAPTVAPTATPVPPPATTPPIRSASTTKVKVKTRTRVKIIATVRVGTSAATGKVTFKIDRRKIIRRVTLKNGRATLTLTKKHLKKLGNGMHRVKVAYAGSATARPSSGKATFTLR